MPSREFVERVLTTGRADEEIVDEDDEVEPEADEPQASVVEEVEETEEAEEKSGDDPDEEPEEEGEGEPEEDDADADDGEEPPEAEAVQQEDEFYLGTYRTREEAEKGHLEKEQHISRLAEETHQMRERMAQYEGYLQAMQTQQAAPEPGEFEEWASQYFEAGQAHQGWQNVMEAYQETGDEEYLDTYVEMWKEYDPYEASRMRNLLDTAAALNQQQAIQGMPRPPSPQDVINESWVAVAETDPDLKDEEFAAGVGKILKNVPALRAAALSGDPDQVRSAIAVARDGYRMQSARTGNGTPRRVKSSDAERLREDKLAATVTTGDSAPERGRASTPEVPPELQDMMQKIQRGEAGFPKLRE